ncbi:unnamed protein product [Aphanomyces euteiches]
MQDERNAATERVILHLDLDCFYAQVEHERLNIPQDQPLAVQQWGSLLAVNYVARAFDVKRSENIGDARKKCPQIHLPHVETLGEGSEVAPNRSKQKAILRRYRVASRQVFLVIAKHVPLYEKASIDEAYMDVTQQAIDRLDSGASDGMEYGQTHVYGIEGGAFPHTRQEKLLCIGAQIAQEIRDDIQQTLHFTTSVGIATNKLLSKLASPLHKPNGQTLIPPRSVQDFMQTFRVDKIRGLGGKLGARIVELSTKLDKETSRVTAGEIVDEFGLAGLQQQLGVETGIHVYNLCQGFDGNEPVNPKKTLVAHINSVKSFEKTGILKSDDMLRYWLRILCEEMVTRFDEEREENQRIPTQLTIHYERPGHKKQFKHFAVPHKIDTESFFAAALAQIEISTALPCSLLYLVGKDFVPISSGAAKITQFFKGVSAAPIQPKEEVSPAPLPSRHINKTTPNASIARFFSNNPTSEDDGRYFCVKCGRHIDSTAAEHDDYHMALELSSQWNEPTPPKKRPKGPMDSFVKK